jgi:transposase-like protein
MPVASKITSYFKVAASPKVADPSKVVVPDKVVPSDVVSSKTAPVPDYFVWLFWTFLSETSAHLKNPKFDEFIPSCDTVELLANESDVVFIPGLLDAVQSPTPPSLEWFKSLPQPPKKSWGVYALVLEKAFSRSRVYVGSGTNATDGVHKRWNDYDHLGSLPSLVQAAFDEGYVITHKGVLCHSPIAPIGSLMPLRALFLVMEAALAIVFWAMADRDIDYGMPHVCPWSLDAFDYDGACSHSALSEGIRGEEEGLSIAEIMARRAAAVERDLAQKKAKYHLFKALDFEGFKAKRRQYGLTYSANHPEERKRTRKRVGMQNRAAGKYMCHPCNRSFPARGNLEDHYRAQVHIDTANGVQPKTPSAAARRTRQYPAHSVNPKAPSAKALSARKTYAANRAAGKYSCALCNYNGGCNGHLNVHYRSQQHKDEVAAAAAATSQPTV